MPWDKQFEKHLDIESLTGKTVLSSRQPKTNDTISIVSPMAHDRSKRDTLTYSNNLI